MVNKKTKKMDSKDSRYSRMEKDPREVDDVLEEDFEEPIEDENLEEYGEEPTQPTQLDHIRSRGLFNNIWWKKGLLKGFVLWFVIVIIFYLFDFLGMVEVIDWKRWAFFLVLLLILGMGYQKYFSGKVTF